jgi:hypothetical protein
MPLAPRHWLVIYPGVIDKEWCGFSTDTWPVQRLDFSLSTPPKKDDFGADMRMW